MDRQIIDERLNENSKKISIKSNNEYKMIKWGV